MLSNLSRLITSGNTIFTIGELSILLDMKHMQSVRNYLSKLGKNHVLRQFAYGVRGFRKYNKYELACKLKKDSYISLHTVLDGDTSIIHCVSTNTIKRTIDKCTYSYHRMQKSIAKNSIGIRDKGGYKIATRERALCDKIYFMRGSYVGERGEVSGKKLRRIAKIYPSYVSENIAFFS